MNKLSQMAASLVLFVLCTLPAQAAERQILQGHVPKAVADGKLPSTGRLPATKILPLVIGLPFRDPQGLTTFLKDVYTPGNPNFRMFLTFGQFTEKFGPTEQDYQGLLEFARTNGLTVTGTSTNRKLLDLKASVADIERVFHVTMRVYQHPTEGRTFFAPDVEPSLDLAVPVLHISGLDNYIIPHRIKSKPVAAPEGPNGGAQGGSGSGGSFLSQDLRTAYVPGVSLTGSGQWLGLLEYDAYYTDLIQDYLIVNGLPLYGVTIENWELDGASGNPGPDYGECDVDIEMAIAMAPGLDMVIVYELPTPSSDQIAIPPDDALNLMAAQGAYQLSSSWEYQVTATTDEIFQEMAAQGQSFFQASGDGGGRTGTNVFSPFDDPYITLVGGTELTTNPNGSYGSEVVYNDPNPSQGNYYSYSGGGISPTYAIPWWQQGISMSANGGSTTMRNMPDVAMVAYNVFAFYSETGTKSGGYNGTSVAAPLWAGFMALVNQQAGMDGLPSIGFANPAIYAIGRGSSYSSCFHDITSGNNENPLSPTAFSAVTGYDLCTGWGTPKGQALINALCSTPGGLIYVQFGNSSPGNGTWASPYNTMALGVAAVPAIGAIMIKGPCTSAETMTISKPMTINAEGGAGSIGD